MSSKPCYINIQLHKFLSSRLIFLILLFALRSIRTTATKGRTLRPRSRSRSRTDFIRTPITVFQLFFSHVRISSSSLSLPYANGDEPRVVIGSRMLLLGAGDDGKSIVRSMTVSLFTEEFTSLRFVAGTWISSSNCSSMGRRFTFSMDSASTLSII